MNFSSLSLESDFEEDPGISWHKEILSELNSKAQIKGALYNYDFLEDAPLNSEDYRYDWSISHPKKFSGNLSGSDSNVSTDSENLEDANHKK